MLGRIFLGRYETIRQLGEGGMGRVYLARQLDLGRQVVVKVMHEHIAADPKFRDRFQRETLLMARFQHPYVVTLYDASLNDPEGSCIVMEYVKGIALDVLLRRNGRLSPQRLSRLLGQLCEALQAAHTEGIVHRDLKPANLMVADPDTPYEKIKVMDFGLAKMIEKRKPLHLDNLDKMSDTNVDFAVGTPGYISPEQVRGDGMDHRSDLYSVGVILYELLTGKLPFTHSETMEVLLAHATELPPSFADLGLAETISTAIEDVVLSCMAKNPADRPQSARELAEMYEDALVRDYMGTDQPSRSSRHTMGLSAPNTSALTATQSYVSSGVVETDTSVPMIPQPKTIPEMDDPAAVVLQMEAWMPEKIAVYKLRGFMDDVGGEVLENQAGRIRVRLGGKGGAYQVPSSGGPLAWLGFGRKPATIEMEMRLERSNPAQQSMLSITVIMRSSDPKAAGNPLWRMRCQEIFIDLRGYLMGNDVKTTG